MTPKKARQRQHAHNSSTGIPQLPQVQASDYDSEVPYQPPTTRTNEELNLAVLQRYNPSITSILSIAPSATIYTFETAWERSGIEGTLFVCQTTPNPTTGAEGYCIVILNRRALENLIMDVRDMENVEIQDDYLILQVSIKASHAGDEDVMGQEQEKEKKVIGVFMHNDKEETRRVNNMMVKECWEKVRMEAGHSLAALGRADGLEVVGAAQEKTDVPFPGFGKRVSLTDLFGR